MGKKILAKSSKDGPEVGVEPPRASRDQPLTHPAEGFNQLFSKEELEFHYNSAIGTHSCV